MQSFSLKAACFAEFTLKEGVEWFNGQVLRLMIKRSGFDSQRRQAFLNWLWRAIHPSQVLAERD